MIPSVSAAPPTRAKLGGLSTRVVLDDPNRVHYGNDIPVSGSLLLKYLPLLRGLPHSPLNAELFGPLQVEITLGGSARINHVNETRAEVFALVKEVVCIHDGPFRASPDEERRLPFAIRFPAHAIPSSNTTGVRSWPLHEHVLPVEREALPPTCSVHLNHDAWETRKSAKWSSTTDTAMSVDYTIDTQVRMPGIKMEIVDATQQGGTSVLYDQPKIPLSIATCNQSLTSEFSQTFTAQNEALRPSSERPHGVRNKTKALLKPAEVPRFIFEAELIGIPKHAYVGRQLSFALSIIPHASSTVQTAPNLFLDSCTITLIAHTTGLQPAVIEIIKTKEAAFSSAKPYSEEYGWTKSINIGQLSWVPSTFTFRNIRRTYKLRIAVQFSVGAQKMKMSRDVPLTIHPPVESDTTRVGTAEDPDSLPSYQESSYGSRADLGPVPSYEQAMTTTTTTTTTSSSSSDAMPHDPAPSYGDHNVGFASASLG